MGTGWSPYEFLSGPYTPAQSAITYQVLGTNTLLIVRTTAEKGRR